MLHVAHIVLSLDAGGLERMVLHLSRQGQRLGQRVSVICLERPGTLAPQAEADGARVVCVDKPPGIRLGTVRRIREQLELLRPDVIHTHQITALLYAGPAARRAGVPAVHTEHGKNYAHRLRTRLLGRLAARHAARFFAVSRDIADEVIACRIAPARKVVVMPNGIDTRRIAAAATPAEARAALGIPDSAPVIGTVGRLAEIKRQDLLIRGFARVRSQLLDARLVIIGDGPLRADLERLAASLGLGASVHFRGYSDSPERYLPALDLFALTSRSEGMPLALLEAWAAGLPVVASNVGGLAELMADGRTGILFPSGDEAALVSGLLDLLRDEERARRLGHCGRELVRARFDLAQAAAAYHRHYEELLGRCDGTMRVQHSQSPAAVAAAR